MPSQNSGFPTPYAHSPVQVLSPNGKALVRTLRLAAQNRILADQSISTNSASFTGYVTQTTATATNCSSNRYVLTLGGTITGNFVVGAVLTSTGGTGGNLPPNTTIVRINDATHVTLNQEPTLPTSSLTTLNVTATYGVLTAPSATGNILPNDVVQAAGVYTPDAIVSQLTGTTGQAGTYVTTQTASVASSGSPIAFTTQTAPVWSVSSTEQLHASATTCSLSGTTLTVGGYYRGTFNIGQTIAEYGSVTITALGTGTGQNGTYTVTNPNSVSFSSVPISTGQGWGAATAGSGNGVQWTNSSFNYSGTVPVAQGTSNQYVTASAIMSSGPNGSTTTSNLAMNIHFYHNGSRLEFGGAAGKFMIWVDDQLLFATPTTLTGTNFVTINFGFKKKRRIDIKTYTFQFSLVNTDLNDEITRAPIRGPRMVVYGDSLSGGSMASGSTTNYFGDYVARRFGIDDAIPIFAGGTGFVANNNGTAPDFTQHLKDIINLNPEVVLIEGGVNDQNASPAQVLTNANTVFDTLQNALPNALVIGTTYRAQGPSGGASPWTSNSLSVLASIKTAAQSNGAIWANPIERTLDGPYGTAVGAPAAGSIFGYITPGFPDTLTVTTNGVVALTAGMIVGGLGNGAAIATVAAGNDIGVYTLNSSGVIAGSPTVSVAFPIAWGARLVSALTGSGTEFRFRTLTYPQRGAFYEIDTGVPGVTERFQCLDFTLSAGAYWMIDGVIQYPHAAGAYIRQVGSSYLTGSGYVTAATGYGNADFYTCADGTHPTDAGSLALGDAIVNEFLAVTSPNGGNT